jgi:serpin B
VGSNYGGGLHLLDFSRPSAATAAINQWVAERTENRIQDLITLDAITPDTRLVLTNAVYFLAKWELPFAPRATDDRRFTLLDGKQVKVRMMHQENHFAYAEDDGWQAIQLPYQGGQVACDVVLPAAGGFAAFEQGLTAEKLDSLLGKLHGDQVMLSLPRFKATTTLSLAKALKALGMKDAFVYPAADFNGISAGGQLYISAVLHKAFVEVDESKTEAAAATAVVAIPGAAAPARPPKIIEMIVDHPFLFLIRDLPTGQILFWGRVVNPAG